MRSNTWGKLVIVSLIAVSLVSPPMLSVSFAQDKTETDDERAKRLYTVGVDLYEGGRYQAAIEVFEEAYALSKRHLLLENIASAYEKLGNLEKAISALENYIPHAGGEREAIQQRIRSLRARQVKASPTPTPTKTPPKKTAETSNTAAWVTLVGGGLILVTGGVIFGLGESDHAALQDDLDKGVYDLNDESDLKAANDINDSADQSKLLGYILMGVGAATMGTSAFLFASDQDEKNTGNKVSIGIQPNSNGGILSLGGRF